MLYQLLDSLFLPKVQEGILGIGKKKKKKKDEGPPGPPGPAGATGEAGSPAVANVNQTACPDPPSPLQYPNPTASDQAAVYANQLSSYSSSVNDLSGEVAKLTREVMQCTVDLSNEQQQSKQNLSNLQNQDALTLSNQQQQSDIALKNQKDMYLAKIAQQEKMYENRLDKQQTKYEKQLSDTEIELQKKIDRKLERIKQLRKNINHKNGVISQKDNALGEKSFQLRNIESQRDEDENDISKLEYEIDVLNETVEQVKLEAIARAERFGYPKANVEANIYNSQIDSLFNDINTDKKTMEKQNMYAYTLKDHIRKIKKELQIINTQIELYTDKVHLNERKSTYEQQEVDMEQAWEIGLHIVYSSIFLGIIIYLCITKDPTTNTPKIMNPMNIGILIFLLLYPMLIYPMTKTLYEGVKYGITKLPKDIYMNI